MLLLTSWRFNCPLVSQSLVVLPSKESEYQKQQAAGSRKALHEVVKAVKRQLSPCQSGLLSSTTASPPASTSPSTGRPATAMARSSPRGTSGSAPASRGSPRSCRRSSAWSSPPCCPCSAWWFSSELVRESANRTQSLNILTATLKVKLKQRVWLLVSWTSPVD